MDTSSQWRSAPRWVQAWSLLAPCMWSALLGALRDRLNALTRKTHAFAKRDDTWDALVGLQLFDHHFHRAHLALRQPLEEGKRRYRQQSPAMALGLTDHLWSFQELLTSHIPITP